MSSTAQCRWNRKKGSVIVLQFHTRAWKCDPVESTRCSRGAFAPRDNQECKVKTRARTNEPSLFYFYFLEHDSRIYFTVSEWVACWDYKIRDVGSTNVFSDYGSRHWACSVWRHTKWRLTRNMISLEKKHFLKQSYCDNNFFLVSLNISYPPPPLRFSPPCKFDRGPNVQTKSAKVFLTGSSFFFLFDSCTRLLVPEPMLHFGFENVFRE